MTCAFQLTLFSAGGPQDGVWAPHLTLIPIPLLSEVRAACDAGGDACQILGCSVGTRAAALLLALSTAPRTYVSVRVLSFVPMRWCVVCSQTTPKCWSE